MTIRLLSLDDATIGFVRARIARLAGFGDNAPPLLRRVPLGELQARGALRETVLTYEQAQGSHLQAALATGDDLPRARILLLDAENRQVGALGVSWPGGQMALDYLAENDCDDLVAALSIAEALSEELQVDFEARLVLIQDLILLVLLLVPDSSGHEPYVFPLSPTYDSTVLERPVALANFLAWLLRVWSRSGPSVS